MIQMNFFSKQKQTHKHREQTCGCRGRGGEWRDGIYRELGINTRLYFKWITKKVLCIAQETLLSFMRQPGWDGSSEKNGYMCICACVQLFATP